MLHQIPRRDDKVEEISMQILTGKQMLKGRIELFKEIYSACRDVEKDNGALQGNSAPGRKWVL